MKQAPLSSIWWLCVSLGVLTLVVRILPWILECAKAQSKMIIQNGDSQSKLELELELEKSLFGIIEFCTFVQQQSAKITKSSGDPY